jgi:hypothetical protein
MIEFEMTNQISIKLLQLNVSMENSLFRQNKFPVPCRTGNILQSTVIVAQMGAGTRWKGSKLPEMSKNPCYFPCSQFPTGLWPDLQGTKLLLLCGRVGGTKGR